MLPDASYRHEYDRLRQITKIRISIIEFTIFFYWEVHVVMELKCLLIIGLCIKQFLLIKAEAS